ncbi:hypothetical protein [Fusibacter sp. JL216-2]|uniref:hypothetical protein n=1 Tax=Fusibacter sp. JL216-2 TaxID=3071453 RepID=UPI003D353677
MWKINNRTNGVILNKFHLHVVKPFLVLIIECSRNKEYDLINYISCCPNPLISNNKSILLYLVKKKYLKRKISDVVSDIVMNYSYNEIIEQYKIFQLQKKSADQFDYNIREEDIIEELYFVFSKFFYDKLFDDQFIWSTLGEVGFNRKLFHSNFYSENQIGVCAYCDLDTTLNSSNNYVEHFLPRSSFPFLSMHPNNLISSCGACNKQDEGKGVAVMNPIFSPFNLQIGDSIDYSIDYSNQEIDLSANQIEVNNYISLLQLSDRYKKPQVFRAMLLRAASIYDILNEFPLSELELRDYLIQHNEKTKKVDPMGFLLNQLFNRLDDYEKFRK